MAPSRGEKPYRVYRGGRARGRVPLPTHAQDGAKAERDGFRLRRRDGERERRERPERGRRPPNWGRRVGVTLLLLVLVVIAWAVTSFLAFRSGVEEANRRIGKKTRATLVDQNGLLLSQATNILLLGTDHAQTAERAEARRSDSMLLLRSDPDRNRLVYLSILRDLRVDVPGYGPNKINAASQFGGPALAVRTVKAVTGLPVHHIVLVDFADFRELIDELGGITVDVPRRILSNRFDCPFASAVQCQRWPGWRFAKGKQHMDGRRALVYSRIRKNRLHPSESDATRAARQQQVLQAIGGRLTGVRTLARLPFVGDELLKPISTDLTAAQLVQLGWVKFRAGTTLNCRLGGTAFGGFILADEERFAVLQMVSGRSAPQPPRPGSPYGSGCAVDRALG